MKVICKAITVKKTPCKKYAKCGDFCHWHKTQHDLINLTEDDKQVEVNECPICMEEKDNVNMMVFSCRHGFCKECISQLNKHDCPLCRKDISDEIPDTLKKVEDKNMTVEQLIEAGIPLIEIFSLLSFQELMM